MKINFDPFILLNSLSQVQCHPTSSDIGSSEHMSGLMTLRTIMIGRTRTVTLRAASKMTKVFFFVSFDISRYQLSIQEAVYVWNSQCSLIVESPIIGRQFNEVSKAFRNCFPFSEVSCLINQDFSTSLTHYTELFPNLYQLQCNQH